MFRLGLLSEYTKWIVQNKFVKIKGKLTFFLFEETSSIIFKKQIHIGILYGHEKIEEFIKKDL